MLSGGEVVVTLIGVAVLYALFKFEEREERRREKVERKRKEDQMNQKMEAYQQPLDWHERRSYVLERDHHQCTKCGSTDSLHVHHVIPRKVRRDHSAGNLVTLCHECHGKEHNIRFASNDELELRLYLRSKAHCGRQVKARKSHACDYCKRTIASGSYYIRIEAKNFPYDVLRLFQAGYGKLCIDCAASIKYKH